MFLLFVDALNPSQAINLSRDKREAAKKVLFLMAGPLRKKRTFFGTFFSNVQKSQRPLSSRGGGG